MFRYRHNIINIVFAFGFVVITFLLNYEAYALETISRDPYIGAIVIDASNGQTIYEDHADRQVYPASTVKMMDMLIIMEQLENGALKLSDQVYVNAKSAGMGGTQVFLKEGEHFSVEEMLYALMIKSANDVAVALAIHIGGTCDNFVKLMNAHAKALGMNSTEFHSVHGLPPDSRKHKLPDISTARDMAKLSMALLKYPEVLRYTSTKERWFRDHTFKMETHNYLLKDFPGCDGLKTGYYRAAGFSISATAKRHNRRMLAVVMGCKHRDIREEKTRELLSKGFASKPVEIKPAITKPVVPVENKVQASQPQKIKEQKKKSTWGWLILPIFVSLACISVLVIIIVKNVIKKRDNWKYNW